MVNKKLLSKTIAGILAVAMVFGQVPYATTTANAAKKTTAKKTTKKAKKTKTVKAKKKKSTSKKKTTTKKAKKKKSSKKKYVKVGGIKVLEKDLSLENGGKVVVVPTRIASKKNTKTKKYVRFTPSNVSSVGFALYNKGEKGVVKLQKLNKGKYEVRALKEGTALVLVRSRAKMADGKKAEEYFTVKVGKGTDKVEVKQMDVKQTGSRKIAIVNIEPEQAKEITDKDVVVTQKGSKVPVGVEKVSYNKDKKELTIKLLIPLINDTEYEVALTKLGINKTIKANVGAPAAIESLIKDNKILVNTPTELKYRILDANGIDVTDEVPKENITVSANTTSGFYDPTSNKLTVYTLNSPTEVTVTYHTWQYENGKEKTVEGKFTITAVDKLDTAPAMVGKYTITNDFKDWNQQEQHQIAQGATERLYLQVKGSDGNMLDNVDHPEYFQYEAVDTSIAFVTSDGYVYGTREGTTYIKVTYRNGAATDTWTLPITVAPSAKVTGLIAQPAGVTISSTATYPTPVSLKVLNQYGKDQKFNGTPNFEKVSGEDVATLVEQDSKATKEIEVGILPTGNTGVGVYKITVDNVSTQLTVNAQQTSDANSNKGYVARAISNKMDFNINKATKSEDLEKLTDGIAIDLVQTQNGLLHSAANLSYDMKDIKINGNPLTDYNGIVEKTSTGIKFTPVHKHVVNGKTSYVVTAKQGSYRIDINAKDDEDKSVPLSMTVLMNGKVTQPVMNKSYSFNKVYAGDTISGKALTKQLISNGVDGSYLLESPQDYSVFLTNKGKAYGSTASIETKNNSVFIDTAALPSVLTDSKDMVWVVVSGIKGNNRVEFKEGASFTEAPIVEAAKFRAGSDVNSKGAVSITLTGKKLDTIKGLKDASKWSLTGANAEDFELGAPTVKYQKDTATISFEIKATKKVAKNAVVNAKFDNSSTGQTIILDIQSPMVIVTEDAVIAPSAEGAKAELTKENATGPVEITGLDIKGFDKIVAKDFEAVVDGEDSPFGDVGNIVVSQKSNENAFELKFSKAATKNASGKVHITVKDLTGSTAKKGYVVPEKLTFDITVDVTGFGD